MAFQDIINLYLRDHEGFTGDGRGGFGTLPSGDRSTARKPIDKRDLRDLLMQLFGLVGDVANDVYAALETLDIGPNGLIFADRNSTSSTLAASLPNGAIFWMGADQYRRDDAATGASSATFDFSVDGIVPAGNIIWPGHFGAMYDGIADDSGPVGRWLNYLVSTPGTMAKTHGYCRLESEVVIPMDGERHIHIEGPGMNTGGFLVANSTGGILFEGEGVGRKHSVQLSNLHFQPGLSQSGYPFQITGSEGGSNANRSAIIRNVQAGPIDESEDRNFTLAPRITGVFRPDIDNMIVYQNGAGTVSWDRILDISGCQKPTIRNSYFKVNPALTSPIGIYCSSASPEGFHMDNVTVSGCDVGLDKRNVTREPELSITNCHFNCNVRNLRLDRVKYISITNNLFYMNPISGGSPAIDIQILDCQGADIRGNSYKSSTPDPRQNHIYLGPVTVENGNIIKGVLIDEAQFFASCTGGAIFVGGLVEDTTIRLPKNITTGTGASYPSGLTEINGSALRTHIFRSNTFSSYWNGQERELVEVVAPTSPDDGGIKIVFHDAPNGHPTQRIRRGAAGTGPGGVGRAIYVDD